jgi:hypothetical protein
MNAKLKCGKIEPLIYLTDDELSTNESVLLSEHLKSCPHCKKIRLDFLTTRQLTIQPKVSVQDYPDFTQSTRFLINAGSAGSNADEEIGNLSGWRKTNHGIENPSGWSKSLTIIRYISGIASILLLALFIGEQTLSVHRITMLEARIQSEPSLASSGFIDQITIARATISEKKFTDKILNTFHLTDKQLNDLFNNQNINDFSISRLDLKKIKMLIQNHPRPFGVFEPGLLGFLQNTSILTRNTLTSKNHIK